MFGHYVLTLYRSLVRHRLYAALNVLGLSIGVAVFLLLFLDVQFETGFDRWIPQAESTFRIDETLPRPGQALRHSAKNPSVIVPLLAQDYPQISAFTRFIPASDIVRMGESSGVEETRYVDPAFFSVLSLPLIAGDPRTALSSSSNVVITERIAQKYFGTTSVLGRSLTLVENGAPANFRITGVLRDLPRDTHLKLDVLKVLTPAYEASDDAFINWNHQSGSSYVRFRNPEEARAVQADLQNFVVRRASGAGQGQIGPKANERLKLFLRPLPAIHFETDISTDDFTPNVDRRVVTSLAIVGWLTLIIAALNYVNLAAARSTSRAREVALRKTLGATRAMLIAQFLAEAVATVFLAVLIGVAMAELALPVVNAAGGTALSLSYGGSQSIVPMLMLIVVFVGLGSGLYPAFLLSNFKPVQVFAAGRSPAGGRLGGAVRNLLVLVQFVAAIAFTICTLVLSAQAHFLQVADRGFQHDGLILVQSMQSDEMNHRQSAILDAFRAIPGVVSASVSDIYPLPKMLNETPVSRPGLVGVSPTLYMSVVGPDFFRTYRASIIAGRPFDEVHKLDDITRDPDAKTFEGANAVINKAAVKSLGFRSEGEAIGKSVSIFHGLATIVGVSANIRFSSPHSPVPPAIYFYSSKQPIGDSFAAVRYEGVAGPEMTARLKNAWRMIAPGQPFVASTADYRLSDYYLPEQQRARLFSLGAVLAVGIACIGLYGLAAFNTTRRYREIGVRKTLGASTIDVLKLLLLQMLRPVLVANLIAWPLAFLVMQNWLSSFDQRVGLSLSYFLEASVLTFFIAFLTVVGQVSGVARSEPAKALRYE